MEKIIFGVAFFRKNKGLVLAAVAIAALVVIVMAALTRVGDLNADIKSYKEQISVLSDRVQSLEGAETACTQLDAEIAVLEKENINIMTKAEALETKNQELENENTELAANMDELERLNGDLLKKLDGLSRPN